MTEFHEQFESLKKKQTQLAFLLDQQRIQLQLIETRRRRIRWVYSVLISLVILLWLF